MELYLDIVDLRNLLARLNHNASNYSEDHYGVDKVQHDLWSERSAALREAVELIDVAIQAHEQREARASGEQDAE